MFENCSENPAAAASAVKSTTNVSPGLRVDTSSTVTMELTPTASDDDNDESDLNEFGGMLEPPVTPVGRDELALRRHRFFNDLMVASQITHRVRFDPRGPSFSGPSSEELLSGPCQELESLVTRLEAATGRLDEILTSYLNSATDRTLATSVINLDSPIDSISDIEARHYKAMAAQASQGYREIIQGPLAVYVEMSQKIGNVVADHAKLVSEAFAIQLAYVEMAVSRGEPNQSEQVALLGPTSSKIQSIQELREKNRSSEFFNHLSAISESIPALGWVTVKPAPAPYVKEMSDAGQFYTNRVLKDWKEKNKTHVEWVKAWLETLSSLQRYVKSVHTTGLLWGKGGGGGAAVAPPPPPPGGMPPPPPPIDRLSLDSAAAGEDRSALFAEINQGENITRNLKKVTSDMQTHKNPGIRSGPAPFKAPGSTGVTSVRHDLPGSGTKPNAEVKPPVFLRHGKKWLVEHQRNNNSLVIDNVEMNNVVYVYNCFDSTLTIKGKINSVVLDSCKKISVLLDSLVSSIEFVNCQSMQMQVLGKVPTITIDKTDGCQMYLSKESMEVEIVSSKSSAMNVLIPTASGEYTEVPIPEQYKTVVNGNALVTTPVESQG